MEKILDDVRRDAILKLKTAKGDLNQLADAGTTVISLYNTARYEGLLALEEKAEEVSPGFLKRLLMLVVYATDPEKIVEIATNEYWINALEDADAMRDYIYIRGVLGIQAGENLNLLEIILQSLMPVQQGQNFDEKAEEINREAKMCHDKATAAKFSNIFMDCQDVKTAEQIHAFEKSLLSYSDRVLQRMIRDIDNRDMAVCMYAFQEDMRRKVLNNVTKRLGAVLMELVVELAPIQYGDVAESIAKVQGVIKRLRESGEI